MRNMVDIASGSWLFREGEMRMDADTTRSAPIANGLFTWPSGEPRLVRRYAARTGFDVEGIRWYEAFAAWKTAVILQQLYARWVRGEGTNPRMAERGPMVAGQVRRALAILDGEAP